MADISKRIDQVCEAKRFNYKQLAEAIDVSSTAIYNIVNGKNKNPTIGFIEKFKTIGVNPSWFLTGVGEMDSEPDSVILNKSQEVDPNFFIKQIEQKDSLIRTLQGIIDSQLVSLGKWFDVSFSRFVFYFNKIQISVHQDYVNT